MNTDKIEYDETKANDLDFQIKYAKSKIEYWDRLSYGEKVKAHWEKELRKLEKQKSKQ